MRKDVAKEKMKDLKSISDEIVSLLERNLVETEEMEVVLKLAKIEFEFISKIDPTRM